MQAKGKRSGGKKGSAAAGGAQPDLVRELTALLPDIQAEGLQFLLNQARVLLHNQQVEKVNAELAKLQDLEHRQRKSARPEKPAAGSEGGAPAGVDIEEGESGTSFVLVLSPARKFLNREEMRGLVRLCRAADAPGEAGTRLHRWLSRHRRDILLDAGIQSGSDPRLAALAELVRGRYTVADES